MIVSFKSTGASKLHAPSYPQVLNNPFNVIDTVGTFEYVNNNSFGIGSYKVFVLDSDKVVMAT